MLEPTPRSGGLRQGRADPVVAVEPFAVSLAGTTDLWPWGSCFGLVFSTSYQRDDSMRVASGMEIFK